MRPETCAMWKQFKIKEKVYDFHKDRWDSWSPIDTIDGRKDILISTCRVSGSGMIYGNVQIECWQLSARLPICHGAGPRG